MNGLRTTEILRRGVGLVPVVAGVTAALLVVRGIAPAPAQAVDLFPVDDWIGDGLKGIGKIVLGPIKLGAEGIAKLLGAIVAALADLLIPKSFVEAGVGAIRWLVELPPLGTDPAAGVTAPRMPHLRELRDTLTWIGLTLLPLQLVVAGGRSLLSPSVDGDSPTEVLQRTIAAALGLIAFDWIWGALTELVRLITASLLQLPWVADGVRRMLQALVLGGAGGTAVAAEFVVPLILAVAGAVLLALMLLRVGLEVVAALVYATGGLALGLSVSGAGARLLQAWMIAATAVFVLPVIWCVVFVCGAALMLDAGGGTSGGGFGDFVGQLYNIGAALVTFGMAIKLARSTLGHAGAAMTGLAAASRFSGQGSRGVTPASAAFATRATPQSLTRFSQRLRGGAGGAAVGVARVGAFPVRHPVQAAAHARHPVQATQAAANHVRTSAQEGAAPAGPTGREPTQRRSQGNGGSTRNPAADRRPLSRGEAPDASPRRPASAPPRASGPSVTRASAPGATRRSGPATPTAAPQDSGAPIPPAPPAATALTAWRSPRRVALAARRSKKPDEGDRKQP